MVETEFNPLSVGLGDRSYPIYIGSELLGSDLCGELFSATILFDESGRYSIFR